MRILQYFGIAVGIMLFTLAMIAGGVYLWALTALDTSQFARALVWRAADVEDWQRFPSRLVRASLDPVRFAAVPQTELDAAKIDGTILLSEFLEGTDTTAFIVLHDDELLYERYFNGSNREAIQTSFSITKSFTSTLVGIAIDEGYITSLDDPVTTYVPELQELDPRFSDITIRHLIAMTSGLRFRVGLSPWNDAATAYYATDLRTAALGSKIEEPPGTRFLYNNYNPLLIGMVLERATGMSVAKYLETRLWQPMGAEADGSWSLDSKRSGFEKMESGINGRAIDFTKFGWIFLNEGRNGERQVVPAAWVEQATRLDTTSDPAAEYQYFWWVDEERNAYYAEGNYGQLIYVYPAARLVLVRMGRGNGQVDWPNFLGDIAQWLDDVLE